MTLQEIDVAKTMHNQGPGFKHSQQFFDCVVELMPCAACVPILKVKRQGIKATRHSQIAGPLLNPPGSGIGKIATSMGRSKSTISAHVFKKNTKAKPVGAPKKMTPAVFARLKKALADLQKRAGGLKEVSIDMVKKRARVELCNRTVLDKFHEEGIAFRKLKARRLLNLWLIGRGSLAK